ARDAEVGEAPGPVGRRGPERLADPPPGARARTIDPAEEVQQRRLAHAGRAHDRRERSFLQPKREAGEDGHRRALAGVGLGEVVGLDGEHRYRESRMASPGASRAAARAGSRAANTAVTSANAATATTSSGYTAKGTSVTRHPCEGRGTMW